ncbi:MAG: hypothetical protein KF767_04220 [Bdellovibrionaceae bacterium]|nr:hypothetical protein [Pseudobdellovibrionaceae bacterium]
MGLRTIHVDRYITPLREGGSLPAIVEGDDQGLYVLKFRGAGQGTKVLIAELIAGELARAAGFDIPEIVFAELDPELARSEPDPEIQTLIRASGGLNLALDYLPGSVTFDPISQPVDSLLASKIVWFDAFITNVDRTARNANMLVWHKKLRLIDHGAALYFHYSWGSGQPKSDSAFPLIKDHVLLSFAKSLKEADIEMKNKITPAVVERVVNLIPDDWLGTEAPFTNAAAHREAYRKYFVDRLANSSVFVQEAERAGS